MREAAASEVRLTTPLPGTLDETFASVREILESVQARSPSRWWSAAPGTGK